MSKVITPEFRASYVNVFNPQAAKNMDGTPKIKNGQPVMEYSIMALFKKGADLSQLEAAAKEALTAKFGTDKTKWPKGLKSPFRDQADREKDGALPDGHEAGAVFMNFKTTVKPGLVNASNQDIIDPVEFYSGCWARAQVNASAYDKNGGRGVAFYLDNVQKLRDDEPLGTNRVKASDAFEPIAGAVAGGNAGGLFD
jgi:hypothetical protein